MLINFAQLLQMAIEWRLCDAACEIEVAELTKAILPRKGVMELARLVSDEGAVRVAMGSNHIRVNGADYCFTSKLVDGAYPDYDRVLPKGGDKQVLVIVLSSSRRLVELRFSPMKSTAVCALCFPMAPLKWLPITLSRKRLRRLSALIMLAMSLEIGFNVSYLLDVLNVLKGRVFV